MENNIQKFFIILCGPTGVGKTGLLNKIVHDLNIGDYVKISIDDYIEQSKDYKTKINTLLNFFDENKQNAIKKITQIVENNSIHKKKLLTDIFNNIYSSNKHKSCKPASNLTCFEIHDHKLNDAIINKKNIFLELNGENDYTWFFGSNAFVDGGKYTKKAVEILVSDEYKKIIVYCGTSYNALLRSNKVRFLDTLNKCINNVCNPRLGNFLLKNIYKNILNNIINRLNNDYKILKNKYKCDIMLYKRIGNKYKKINYDSNPSNKYKSIFFSTNQTIKQKIKKNIKNKKNNKTKKNKN